MAPLALREQAWARLARDLDPKQLEAHHDRDPACPQRSRDGRSG